jgi:hypothetical protein
LDRLVIRTGIICEVTSSSVKFLSTLSTGSILGFRQTVLCSRGERGRRGGRNVEQESPLEVSGVVGKNPVSGGNFEDTD